MSTANKPNSQENIIKHTYSDLYINSDIENKNWKYYNTMKTATFLWITESQILVRRLFGEPCPSNKESTLNEFSSREMTSKINGTIWVKSLLGSLSPTQGTDGNCWHWPGTKTEQESTVRTTRAFFGYVKRFSQVTYESPGPRVIPSPWGGWAYLCPDPLVCGVYNFTLKKSSHFFNTKFLSRCSPNY